MTPPPDAQRRLDLDWIRILALASLILYHVGMYYVTWDWHVKSPHASHAAEPAMMLVNPWRLALLFLVSGTATAFIAARFTPGELARSRTWRLLPPLAFAMVFLIPPQSYFEVVEKAGYAGSYLDFWKRYLLADRTFCRGNDCLVVPTWNHLWFVAYLLVYTLVLAALLRVAPGSRARMTDALERALSGLGVLIVPWLFLAVIRMGLAPRFPSTHALVDDWYNHALFFGAFLLGFLIAGSTRVWEAMERLRWLALGLGLAAYAFIAWYFLYRGAAPPPSDALRMTQRAIYAADQWAFIVAACGFARRHIRRDSAARRYLTDAIFPFYIVHQTAIILFAIALRAAALPPAVEAPIVIVLVAAACIVSYEAVRRVAILRPLFGLRRQPS